MYEVIMLEAASEFISIVPKKMQAKILRTIDLLVQFGPELPMPHSRKIIGSELYELRVRFSSDIVRLFYFHHAGELFIITSGYFKKTNKTNRKEIEKAKRLKSCYEKDRMI